MLMLFDFKCPDCHHQCEELVKRDIKHIGCPECGGIMDRVISPTRFKLEGLTGHFPTAADKWARQHEKAAREEPK